MTLPLKFKFIPVTDKKIYPTIMKLGPHKAPGLDGIPNVVLVHCMDLVVPHLGPLYCATFKLGVYPTQWQDTMTIVLRKLGKPNYMIPAHIDP